MTAEHGKRGGGVKVEPRTLTDALIRSEMHRTSLVSVGVDCAIALRIDARTANGQPPSASEIGESRQRICDAINERARGRCPGRSHHHHVLAVCAGECCTVCGGPIDDDGECRCDGAG